MDDETIKAVANAAGEIARTTGKGVDAGREAGGFIAKYIGGPLEQAKGMWEDKLSYIRWERQVRLFTRAEDFLAKRGLAGRIRPVPLGLVVPLLQGGSLEENDDLQDRWAALLANALDPNFQPEVRRAYVAILEQLTALDARNMDLIYSVDVDPSTFLTGVDCLSLPSSARAADPTVWRAEVGRVTDEIAVSLSNLERLGCVRLATGVGGHESPAIVFPTALGRACVRAWQGPKQ